MSDDILSRIDEAMARNASRFDPLGGEQYDAFDGTSAMRWRPAGAEPLDAGLVFGAQHPASPYLTREDITGRPDRTAEAFRAEVRRQELDEGTIRIEALRPARRAEATTPFLMAAIDAERESFAARLLDRLDKTPRRRWWQWRPW